MSLLAGFSLVMALRSPWMPPWDQAPLRAKGDLRGSFQGLAHRCAQMAEGLRKLDVGSSGGLRTALFFSGTCRRSIQPA